MLPFELLHSYQKIDIQTAMISLFPRVTKFFDLFRQQNDLLAESARLLSDVFQDHSGVAEKCGKIMRNVNSGNEVGREISKALALTFITPIDREDIHAINMAQENALNSIRSVSTRIGLYQFADIKPGAKDLASLLSQMHGEISPMVAALKSKSGVEAQSVRIKQLKDDADRLLLVSLGEIYESGPKSPADLLEVVKWSHIYDRLEEAIARTETLSNILEGVALKNA